MTPLIIANDARYLPGFLSLAEQKSLLETIREITGTAPLYTPAMPRTGKKMSVRMTNCGSLGWVTDKQHGYRYQSTHPVTGEPWPQIPLFLLDIWDKVAACPLPPEACLINFYDENAKMGLHQDRDEDNLEAPVVSISLGDTCRFRIGSTARGGKTSAIELQSGDVVVLAGASRMAFHGVDKIYSGTSRLLKQGGRINLTLRRVNFG